MSLAEMKYKRILIKLSGEALMGDGEYGTDIETVNRMTADIAELVKNGLQVSIVVGGGNIFRGLEGAAKGMDRTTGDNMGMLATVINALTLQNAFESIQVPAVAMSAIPMPTVCEPYNRRSAVSHLENGRVVIFGGGSGNPYFTTDTAGALRAVEMDSDAMIKATQVDGVYSADPKKDPTAERYDQLSYQDVLVKDLKVMDAAAIALAKENNLPVIVCSIWEKGNLLKVLSGQGHCTTVRNM